MSTRLAIVLVAVLLVAVGCRSEEGADDVGSVSGFLVATADSVQLCESLAESFPPQCGGAAETVIGLDPTTVFGVTEAEGVVWTDRPVTLVGDLGDGVVTVPPDPDGSAIVGEVRTTAGGPVTGAVIGIQNEAGEEVELTFTDSVGRYVVRVDSGVYTVVPEPIEVLTLLTPTAQLTVDVDGDPVTVDLLYEEE